MSKVKSNKLKDKKEFENHHQTIVDGFNIFGWHLAQALDEYLNENKGGPDFYGNRILKEKKEAETAWWKSYKAVVLAFSEFILTNEM